MEGDKHSALGSGGFVFPLWGTTGLTVGRAEEKRSNFMSLDPE